jgi:hypothetical protein
VFTGAFNKQQFSTFTGRASPIEDTKAKKITASVDAYESDFGTLKVVANRFQRTRDVLSSRWRSGAVAFLPGRKMVSIPLAIVGDSPSRKSILSEYTLEARNEKASGTLYSSTGTLLANSTLASNGTLIATSNVFQQAAFTASYQILNPGRFWIGYQQSGTTATPRTIAAATWVDVLTGSAAGALAVATASITPPTTFTADTGPIAYVY